MTDIFGGIIVALVSIPISMGYAQIAGLPMEYGLYGSVLPILFFGFITGSKDFVFGVDAAPAALVGGMIASLGIVGGTEKAISVVPMITLLVSIWLLIFYIFKAGRIVRYISESVMAGFVTGICCTIILMQIPKLFGGSPGTGEAPELIAHIIGQTGEFNAVSLILGLASIAIIMLGKKFCPKVPMSVIVMVLGAVMTICFHVDEYGVKLLPHVDRGFGGIKQLSGFSSFDELTEYLLDALSIAAVILAESLLASNSNAMKDGYKLSPDRELLAYTAANFSAALTGCCPVNASVSRTGIVRQFGVKSQWQSVSACISMIAVLYFATPIIEYLPVPVLTAIVVSALMNACEFHIAKKLWKQSRNEFYIFLGALFGVLIFGTVAGVVIGVILSFVAVVVRAVVPPRDFMGVIADKDSFYSLGRNSESRPIKNTVIYRFGGNLFFANIDTLQSDIENAVNENTKCIIINAGAVGNIDLFAAERLVMIYRTYKEKGIKFYITEHPGQVNDMLRKFGAEELLRNGAVRMTTALALRDAGTRYPYETDNVPDKLIVTKEPSGIIGKVRRAVRERPKHISRKAKGIQPELEWVMGEDSTELMDRIADELIEEFFSDKEFSLEDAEKRGVWGRINYFDEDEIIDRVELRLISMLEEDPESAEKFMDMLEKRREYIEMKMLSMDSKVLDRLAEMRRKYAEDFKRIDPENYARLLAKRMEYIRSVNDAHPDLAEKYKEIYY